MVELLFEFDPAHWSRIVVVAVEMGSNFGLTSCHSCQSFCLQNGFTSNIEVAVNVPSFCIQWFKSLLFSVRLTSNAAQYCTILRQ